MSATGRRPFGTDDSDLRVYNETDDVSEFELNGYAQFELLLILELESISSKSFVNRVP